MWMPLRKCILINSSNYSETSNMVTVCVWKLESQKFFITAFSRQMLEKYYQWLIIYPLIEIIKTFENVTVDYDYIVLNYMKKYGIENVRGGYFHHCDLLERDKIYLKNELQKLCSFCYMSGKNCCSKKTVNRHFLDSCIFCDSETHYSSDCLLYTNVIEMEDGWNIISTYK